MPDIRKQQTTAKAESRRFNARRVPTADLIATWKKLHDVDGWTTAELCREYGWSDPTIRNYLREAGAEVRKPGGRGAMQRRRIRQRGSAF